MLIVSYGIFHERRRKVVALIPSKARAGIAALTFAAAMMTPFVSVLLATPVRAAAFSSHRRCWTAGPHFGWRWFSRLVATPSENRLSFWRRNPHTSFAAAKGIIHEIKLLKREAFASVLIGAILTLGMSPVAPADAAIVTFFGQDNNAPVEGPFPSSFLAQDFFLAAAATFGPVVTHGFEDQPVGFRTTYTLTNGDATITLNAPNLGLGFSGISNITFGNNLGFSIGGSGQNWLGFPRGSATFDIPPGQIHSARSLPVCRT
jgi:hypothetical protein